MMTKEMKLNLYPKTRTLKELLNDIGVDVLKASYSENSEGVFEDACDMVKFTVYVNTGILLTSRQIQRFVRNNWFDESKVVYC